MKKQIQKFVSDLGGQAAYDGKTKSMYINIAFSSTVIKMIKKQFSLIEFQLLPGQNPKS